MQLRSAAAMIGPILALSAPALADEEFYRGKTIRVIVENFFESSANWQAF